MNNKGFALLIAVIFMAVMLALGLALASLAYKQQVLASSATQSESAFYAADAGLECALRADQQDQPGGDFAYDLYSSYAPSYNFSVGCGGITHTVTTACYDGVAASPTDPYFTGTCPSGNVWVMTWTLPMAYPNPLDQTAGTEKACAIVTIYKSPTGGTTYLFSQGYDIRCESIGATGVNFVTRGLSASYNE